MVRRGDKSLLAIVPRFELRCTSRYRKGERKSARTIQKGRKKREDYGHWPGWGGNVDEDQGRLMAKTYLVCKE